MSKNIKQSTSDLCPVFLLTDGPTVMMNVRETAERFYVREDGNPGILVARADRRGTLSDVCRLVGAEAFY